jgi:NAD-dependent dihydropyrimidine dehydrogenase PreA subunit
MIFIDEDKCSGCAACLEACPEGAIVLRGSVAAIEQERCTGCADCLSACPEAAIYEVEIAPKPVPTASTALKPERQTLSTRQSALARARPVVASTLAAAAPVAVDVLADLVRRWLDERSPARSAGGRSGQSREGGGRRRRRRRRGQ